METKTDPKFGESGFDLGPFPGAITFGEMTRVIEIDLDQLKSMLLRKFRQTGKIASDIGKSETTLDSIRLV